MHELYKKHRPTSLKQISGQSTAVEMLSSFLKKRKVPHSILFSGPSGCGKTTLARILKDKLDCGDIDFSEINCADFRGIDMVREIRQTMHLSPINGSVRMWLIDECHKLSNDAQNAFLKLLEDTPSHVYFVLCTTDPGKLLKTIITRCTEIRVSPLTHIEMKGLLQDIAGKEGFTISDEVYERIVEVSEGSARKGIVLLEQVAGLDTDEARINAILAQDVKVQAIALARAMIKPKISWNEIAGIIKGIEEEPEKIRRLILSYASSVCLSGGPLASKAAKILACFRDHWYDCGQPGLVLACWEVIN